MNTLRKIIFIIACTIAGAMHAETRWLATEHNFGAFDEDDGKVTCVFRMINKGPEDVSVRSARASCGCTTPSYTKNPIAPGDTAEITVAYNPVGRPGRFSKTVKLTLSDNSQHTLTISGVVIGSQNTLRSRYPIQAGPMKFRSDQLKFGSVLKGRAKSLPLEIYNASTTPIRPAFGKLPQYLRVTPAADSIPPGEQNFYNITLSPSDTELYGVLTDSVTVTDPASGAEATIHLAAIIEEDFSRLTPGQLRDAPVIELSTQMVDLQRISGAAPVTRTFTVTNRGRSPLMIRRLSTPGGAVTATISSCKIKKGKSATVTVTIDPALITSGYLYANIQIIANDPAQPISIVRVVGEMEGQTNLN